MTKRIFLSICAVALSVLVLTSVFLFYLLYKDLTKTQFEQLRMQTEMAEQGMLLSGEEYFKGLDTTNYRISWISAEGEVLYDSDHDYKSLENHLDREEIKEALDTGNGQSSRFSSTGMERSLYYALLLKDGTVIRLSVSQSTVWNLLLDITPSIIIVLLIALVLSVVLAVYLSKFIVEPLNKLNLDRPLDNKGYKELAPLLRRIDSQQMELRHQENKLQKKKDELDTVIDSMNEGIILLNSKNHIISINPTARKLLGADNTCIGEDILTVCRSISLQELLQSASKGQHNEKIVDLQGGCYLIDVSPIISYEKIHGYAILFFDITEKRNSEAIRREFTANVSHELKTPLHTIAGYAELMANGMVRDDDVQNCASKIHTEAKRMTNLIEDIINLSHLDEGGTDMQWAECNLLALAKSVINSLENTAVDSDIRLELKGSSVMVNGIPQLLQGIIYNLCDNAIKYNRAGGNVKLEISEDIENAIIKVCDTGIGIPLEHQARIFERFYRVDKSHSKEVGGTGLGLSIVKHSAKIHNARIELESVPNQGTTITVKIPKK